MCMCVNIFDLVTHNLLLSLSRTFVIHLKLHIYQAYVYITNLCVGGLVVD